MVHSVPITSHVEICAFGPLTAKKELSTLVVDNLRYKLAITSSRLEKSSIKSVGKVLHAVLK